ncbi:MAG: DUF4097 family beta strand repeat protein [Ruminiclostridium sp.]|nr:DUF4097 family beta strand repeat protein [Ruminiclostridium sp.]
MSRSGKWLLIFGIIAIVSAVAFGFTVAAFGVTDGNYNINIPGTGIKVIDGISIGGIPMGNAEILFREGQTNVRYDFEQYKEYTGSFDAADFSDIKLSLASCKANVICTDTDKVDIVYKTGSRAVNFTAELNNGMLSLEEKMNSGWSLFGSAKSSELTLTIPETLYNSLDINLASGKVYSQKIKADDFRANVASGSVELGIAAEDIDINIASGSTLLTNCGEDKADKITIQVASGKVELNGYGAEKTTANIASGSVLLNGISGKVNGDLASGKLTMVYSEWNDDLDIHLLSGSADATLPSGSGANASLKRLSGSMSIDLDGNSQKLNSTISGLTVGGSNIHNINGDVASGSIRIHN